MSSGLISWGFSGFWETKRWRKSRSVSLVFYKTSLLVSITGLTRIIRCWPAAQTYCKKAETCGGPRGPASICRSTVSVCFYVFSAALIFFSDPALLNSWSNSFSDPPRNTSLLIRPDEELVEGRHVTFSCHSDGAPAPALVLSRNGMELQKIKPATSSPLTFTFAPILLEHSDLYRCEASNKYGSEVASHSITVKGQIINNNYNRRLS